MGAPVVRDAILPQRFGVLDVRVPSRYGVVGQVFSVNECIVNRNDQTIRAIAKLYETAEVDARKSECVVWLFRQALNDRELEARRRTTFLGCRLLVRDTVEDDVKLRSRPMRFRARHVDRRHAYIGGIAARVLEAFRDPRLQRWVLVEDRRKASTCIT